MNNLLHLKYAIEVARTGSISRAAENLFMGQPHLSKAIRELEYTVGFAIFNRTPKGVVPTVKGMEFIDRAKEIVEKVEQLELLYRPTESTRSRFDVSVPRASYISSAFVRFAEELTGEEEFDLNYRETNSMRAIKNVSDNINNIAVIRYDVTYERYFLNALEERELISDPIWEFKRVLLVSKDSPLAVGEVTADRLDGMTEILHGDLTVPSLPASEARELARAGGKKKKIAVYERASQFELLSSIPTAYMWVSPVPRTLLNRLGLIQRRSEAAGNSYKDVFICRKGYHLTDADMLFVKVLREMVDRIQEENQK